MLMTVIKQENSLQTYLQSKSLISPKVSCDIIINALFPGRQPGRPSIKNQCVGRQGISQKSSQEEGQG